VVYDEDRVAELQQTGLLVEKTVESFDRLMRQAVRAVGSDTGFVGLLTQDRQHLRGCVGLPEPLATDRELPMSHSICAHTIDRDEPLVVDNMSTHELLKEHPAAEEFGVGAYLGVPLRTTQGHPVGTFCLAEWEPRTWSDEDVETAMDFAASAQTEIELRLELQHRRELEAQLRSRTDVFETLVEHISDVVTVMDREGIVQFTNSSAQTVFGYDPSELKGTPIWDRVHPEDHDVLQEALEAAYTTPEDRPTVEFRHKHADGSWRLLEARGQRLPDSVELGAVIGVSRDITEQRKLEQRARLLAAAIQQSPTAVVITGPTLEPPGPKIRYVNKAMTEMTGYSEEELMGRTPRLLQGPETDREALDRLKETLSRGESVVDETVNYRKDGTPYHLRWRITPIWDEEGDVTHYVSVQEDITEEKNRKQELERRVKKRTRELRAARDQAEQASRMKSALLSNMSHEIRTPLTSVIGFAETIQEEVPASAAPIPKFAGMIEKNGRRLLDTLTSLIRLSKLEAGEMELEPAPVELKETIEAAVEFFSPKIEEAGLSVEVSHASPPVRARADDDALSVVVNNLLGNAVKFTEDGGTISVRGRRDGDWAVVEVVDNGIGMASPNVAELFEPFSQASSGFDRSYEGSGLGLAVTKQLVDRMGGAIGVDTEEGTGTCVTVRIPLWDERAGASKTENA
jgi:PAS domain S-box-containing protein